MVLNKCRIGAVVLAVVPESSSHKLGVPPGSLILDINGALVLFETCQSIQKKLDQLQRPLMLRLILKSVIFDVIYWEQDLGLVLCSAIDLATVEAVSTESPG